MSTFGSTQPEQTEEEMRISSEMKEAKQIAIKASTIQGVSIELQTQKQHLNTLNTKIDSVMNLVMTLQESMNNFQRQRAIELNNMVNHGPTSTED